MNKKEEILDELEASREDFLELIADLSEEDLQHPGVVGEWSIKDIMAHISAWEAELVKLLWQVQQGQNPSSIHFSDVSVDEQNQTWHNQMNDRLLERVMADFEAVRKQTVRRVENISAGDLFDPQRYRWLKGKPLAAWIAADTFKHEAEHTAQIRNWLQEQQNDN